MVKGPSPLLGFNNNVRYKGKVFHIQTEDSGLRHPHVITHLFTDGGRIIKTAKTSYARQIGIESFAAVLRQLMKDQHKAMVVALRDGLYDALIPWEDVPAGGATAPGLAPTAHRTLPGLAAAAAAGAATGAAAAHKESGVTAVSANGVSPSMRPPATAPMLDAARSARSPSMSSPPRSKRPSRAPETTVLPAASGQASPSRRPAAKSDIDPHVLERAAVAARVPSVAPPPGPYDLPPPPAALLSTTKPEGVYRSIAPPAPGVYRSIAPLPPPSGFPPPPSGSSPDRATRGASSKPPTRESMRGRYSLSRPPPRDEASAQKKGADACEDGSEKSLDDVIRNYLAEGSDASRDPAKKT